MQYSWQLSLFFTVKWIPQKFASSEMQRRTRSQSGNEWPLLRCAAQTSLMVRKVGDKLPVKSSSLKSVIFLARNLLDLVWSLHFFLLFWYSSLAALSLPAVIPSYDGSWGPPSRRAPLRHPIVSLFLKLAYSILFASSSKRWSKSSSEYSNKIVGNTGLRAARLKSLSSSEESLCL